MGFGSRFHLGCLPLGQADAGLDLPGKGAVPHLLLSPPFGDGGQVIHDRSSVFFAALVGCSCSSCRLLVISVLQFSIHVLAT